MKATIRNILVLFVVLLLAVSVAVAKGNPHKFPDNPVTNPPAPIAPIVCEECTITLP